MSYGAGIGIAALLQRELVERRRAISRSEFMTLYGLARIVPSGTVTALAVAFGYRYQRFIGTVVCLAAMILPSFVITIVLTIAYTLLAGTRSFAIVNLTLTPAALAIVIVSTLRLGQEFLNRSVEPFLAFGAFVAILVFGVNPSLLLVAGGIVGALAIRGRRPPA